METKSAWRKFETLPPKAQEEVIDFIDFLRSRYVNLKTRVKAKSSKLSDEEFVGIWKNRKDLTDSSEWVRHVRQTEWNN